jgi:molecular chaperone GrpE
VGDRTALMSTDSLPEGTSPAVGDTGELASRMEELAKEVTRLNDLFTRRLLEDRDKRSLYDELYRQLESSRAGVHREVIAPVLRQTLLAVDRIDERAEPDEFLLTIRTEILEIYRPYGLEEVDTSGAFDPSQHESVGVSAEAGPPGHVADVRRPGYWLGPLLLRPAQVLTFPEALSTEQAPG